MNKKYEQLSIHPKLVSTAIFEYLLNKGRIPNRKEGVWYDGVGRYRVDVEVRKNKK